MITISASGAPKTPSNSDLLTADQAAELTGHTKHTLAQYRTLTDRGDQRGPAFVRFGRAVFYRRPDVEAYLAARRGR